MRPTVEANYRAPVRGGAWWSAAKVRQRERARVLCLQKREKDELRARLE